MEELVEALSERIQDAIDAADALLAQAEENEEMDVANEIEHYLIPNLRQWIEGSHQPGSVASLHSLIQQENEGGE